MKRSAFNFLMLTAVSPYRDRLDVRMTRNQRKRWLKMCDNGEMVEMIRDYLCSVEVSD